MQGECFRGPLAVCYSPLTDSGTLCVTMHLCASASVCLQYSTRLLNNLNEQVGNKMLQQFTGFYHDRTTNHDVIYYITAFIFHHCLCSWRCRIWHNIYSLDWACTHEPTDCPNQKLLFAFLIKACFVSNFFFLSTALLWDDHICIVLFIQWSTDFLFLELCCH